MTQTNSFNLKNNCLPFVMWFFPLSFFALQFILRLWPGLMMQEIMTRFSIDAANFGLLAAFYYYGYAGMQIPMALLLEKFGAKKVVFIFALLCGLSALLFTSTHNFYLALLSRFLIGASSAVGFLGVSKVISEWFSSTRYSQMVGFSFSVGLLGAVYGGKPLTQLLSTYSSQRVGLVLALCSISVGVFAYLVLRTPKNFKVKANEFNLSHLSVLFTSRILWVLALANLLMVGALEGFADVWGVSFLTAAYGFAKSDAALLVSLIFVGMLFGGPLLAFLSKKIGNYTVIGICGIGLTLAFLMILSGNVSNWWLLSTLFFTIGLMCCYQVIVFAAGSTLVSNKQLGITIAFLNCINMLGGSFFHTVIGKIMDYYWEGNLTENGLKQYSLSSYHHALMVIPACALLGTVLIYLLHRHIKSQVNLKSAKPIVVSETSF
ncbi:MFS transporter [Legionella bozemanae]|uniref:Lysosomal dipeptide transporter MFSD1 n=1 Tax=Legionella bozemanae TaxID=447 RepID=A0A0W0RJB6_LEGBO|nr:MFS transporter [Legionella bozemanae]KTC71155.1 major facilitator family transporter [Legionella bozemanae]STO33290.1 Arabinose efflux permease [Legionella bozemanae]